MVLQDPRGMNYGSKSRIKSSSSNQGEDEKVADGLSDNSSRLTKDGFPQLCEQGDNIGCKRCTRDMGLGSMINVRMVIR